MLTSKRHFRPRSSNESPCGGEHSSSAEATETQGRHIRRVLTESHIRDTVRRRVAILLPVMTVAVAAMFAYFFLVGALRESIVAYAAFTFGTGFAEFVPALLILPSLLLFLVPGVVAEKYAQRFATTCPLCASDITRSTQQLLATRCCPDCGERVVAGGRKRDIAVYHRYREMQARRALKYWFWLWPLLGGFALTWHFIEPSGFQRCPHFLFLPALIGAAAGAWAFCRTWDRRYVPQTVVSAVLFVAGALAFWHAV